MILYWIVYGVKNDGTFKHYDKFEDAADEAKRLTQVSGNSYDILEFVGRTKKPVPPIEMEMMREPGSTR